MSVLRTYYDKMLIISHVFILSKFLVFCDKQTVNVVDASQGIDLMTRLVDDIGKLKHLTLAKNF